MVNNLKHCFIRFNILKTAKLKFSRKIFYLILLIFSLTLTSFKDFKFVKSITFNTEKILNKQSDEKTELKTADSATITGFTYTADDSTAVIDHLVRLKLANGNQLDSFYTNGSNQWQFLDVPTPVEDGNSGIPDKFALYQNYPNPFNPHTTIRYDLDHSQPVSLKVYNIEGKEIATLVSENQSAGQHEVVWNGKNSNNEQVAQGVYFYRLLGDDVNQTKKMVYLHGSVPPTGINGSMPKENNNPNFVSKPGSIDYIVEIVNLGGTNPQVINTEQSFTLSNDTTFNVYVPRQGSPIANIDLTSLVQMLSGNVPGKYETAQLKQNGNVIQTKNTGESGTALFENVLKNENYTVHVFGDTASRPNINSKDTTIYLIGDTAIVVNPALNLRPAVLANLENKTFNEDVFPSDPRMHDLWTKGTGYDSLGNQVNPAALLYLIQNQSNPNLAPVIIEANQYTKLQSLLPDGNGTNNVTVRAIAPNSKYADKGFNVIISPMTDISGIVDSLYGNEGPVEGAQVKYKTTIVTTDQNGNYHMQIAPSSGLDTLVITKNGFYQRRLSPFNASTDIVKNANLTDTSIPLQFMDETLRMRPPPGTEKWDSQPIWYVNISPPAGGGTITQEEIDTVLALITNDLPKFTNYFFQNPVIEIGTNPPAYGTPGYVRAEWDNTIPGSGEHGEYVNGNQIVSAYAKFRTEVPRGTKLQELSQNLGARNDSNIITSIFNDPLGSNFYQEVDLKLGKFLYSRPAGNLSPDTDQ